ncbi:MAG: GMC family oxidoreductase N-terminal domain-containing protein [Caldilineaceae bacterium]
MNFAGAFDYIVIGAGASGAVVTHRLVQELDCRVLLLEAGSPDNAPAIHNTDIPSMVSLWTSPESDWGYQTVEQRHLNGRSIPIAQGKVLGGSTSINAMMYIRGNRRDFDYWNHLGNAGWSYQDVLPYFKRSEDYAGGASAYHGEGGPLQVVDYANPSPVSQAFVRAAMELGFGGDGWDCNGEQQENGAFFYPSTRTHDNKRCSTAVAFLHPILNHPNLTTATNAQVTRILTSGGRVTGVEYIHNGQQQRVQADSEVIVCAGSFESPKLLMLSGLGPAQQLAAHGITTVVDLPGVGQNLQDHMLLGVGYQCRQEQPFPNLLSEAGLFTYTTPGLSAASPDLQFFFGPVQYVEPEYQVEGPGFTFAPILTQPHSRGTVSLRSDNPLDLAMIDPNYLACEADLKVLVKGIELARELVKTRAFADLRGRELAPGAAVTSHAELAAYVRKVASTVWHPVGTCKMGLDAMAVVDPQLRVYGVDGLRVADASIMPKIVSGNTNAATIMIGEKAADMIIAAQSQQPSRERRPAITVTEEAASVKREAITALA